MADQVPVRPDESAEVPNYLGGMVIDGVAASEALDSSGEILDVEGADISDLKNGLGVLNWEHENGAKDVIGKIIYAHKVFKQEDCEDDRQRDYWDQLELPFIYHQARLYDGAGHEAARAVAAMIRDHAANKEPILVRFSIEGSTLEKDPKDPRRLAATVARRVAATIKPCNRSCHSGLVRDPNGSVAMTKSETGDLAPLHKTLTAGGGGGAPGALTGLAALQPEHLGKKWVAVSLGALRDYRDYPWDRSEFGRVLKHLLPEAPPEYFDSFMDVAEKIRVPKQLLKKTEGRVLYKNDSETLPATSVAPELPMTLRGQPVSPNRHLTRPTFDEHAGILHTPKGSFPMYIPGREDDPQVFIKALSDPQVEDFHGRAVENWARMRDALRNGKTAPEVVMHATLFSQLSPQTPVPVQELQYGHLVDMMRETGVDARNPEFTSLKENWLSRDRPNQGPTHESQYFDQLQGAKSWGKGGTRPPGSFQKFPLSSGKWDSMANYHRMHQGLTDLVNRHRTDGRSATRELMENKVKFGAHQRRKGQVDPFPGIPVNGLAPKTTRYLFGMLGAENVVVPDTHVSRHLFGLDKDKDSATIDYVKRVLWDEKNTPVLEGIDRYYAKHHPAVRFLREHPKYGALFSEDEQALFPAFWRHWLAIPPDERARGMKGQGFNAETDHTPFWRAVDPYVAKSEESTRWRLPAETAAQHDRWVREHGDVPALMLYYHYLAPKLMGDGQQLGKNLRKSSEPLDVLLGERGDPQHLDHAKQVFNRWAGGEGRGYDFRDNIRQRFDVHLTNTRRYYDTTTHEYTLIPRGGRKERMPPMYEGDDREKYHYVSEQQPDGPEFLDDVPEPGLAWRGMDHEGWGAAQKHGEIRSFGNYNLKGQDGLTFYSSEPSTGASYATGYAPWQHQPGFNTPGVVVGVPAEGMRLPGEEGVPAGGNELGAPHGVKLGDVRHIYHAMPYAIRPGTIELSTGHDGSVSEGSRNSPNARVRFVKKSEDLAKGHFDKLLTDKGRAMGVDPISPAQAVHGHDSFFHEPTCSDASCVGCNDGIAGKTHGRSGMGHQADCGDPNCGGACTSGQSRQSNLGKVREWSGGPFLSAKLDDKYEIKLLQHGEGKKADFRLEIRPKAWHPHESASIGIITTHGENSGIKSGPFKYGSTLRYLRGTRQDLEYQLDGTRHPDLNRGTIHRQPMKRFHRPHIPALIDAASKLVNHVIGSRKNEKYYGFKDEFLNSVSAREPGFDGHVWDGNRRYEAARRAGVTHIPILRRGDLAQARAKLGKTLTKQEGERVVVHNKKNLPPDVHARAEEAYNRYAAESRGYDYRPNLNRRMKVHLVGYSPYYNEDTFEFEHEPLGGTMGVRPPLYEGDNRQRPIITWPAPDGGEEWRNEHHTKVPDGMAWRGMDWEGWQNAVRAGHIKSLGNYNLEGQEGLTCWSPSVDTAINYSSGFAPVQHAAGYHVPGVVIGVPRSKVMGPGEHPGIPSSELGHVGEMPISEVTHAFLVHPKSAAPHIQELRVGSDSDLHHDYERFATARWNRGAKTSRKVYEGSGSGGGGNAHYVTPYQHTRNREDRWPPTRTS